MTLKPSPVAFIVFLLAGWISRQQLVVIEYLKSENRMLRERLKGRSLHFTDRERALLARKAFGIPRKVLLDLGTIVTPDTLLRWHRQLIARKFDFTLRGLGTYYVLFIIELAKRVVHIAGITTQPNESWMMQVGRNLTDRISGSLLGKSHLILDRDTRYTAQFRRLISESRTAVIRLPPRSPNLNAYAERFVRSIKEECLDRLIFVGQASLRRAVAEFVVHYQRERNHQGLGNRLIQPGQRSSAAGASVRRRQRLGGLLSFYHLAAA